MPPPPTTDVMIDKCNMNDDVRDGSNCNSNKLIGNQVYYRVGNQWYPWILEVSRLLLDYTVFNPPVDDTASTEPTNAELGRLLHQLQKYRFICMSVIMMFIVVFGLLVYSLLLLYKHDLVPDWTSCKWNKSDKGYELVAYSSLHTNSVEEA